MILSQPLGSRQLRPRAGDNLRELQILGERIGGGVSSSGLPFQ